MSIIRESIMSAVDTQLKAIKTTSGYNTNLGNNVFAWRDKPLVSSEMPGLIYRDRIAARRDGVIGKMRWALQVDIAVFNESTPTDTRKLIADVLKAVGIGAAAQWGGYSQSTELGDAIEMAIERHDTKEGAAIISINIIYDAPKWEC